jgi:amidase
VGVEVAADEVAAYHEMLLAADSAFQRVLAMPAYHVPVDTEKYPRNRIHKPNPSENVLGVAWAHTFSVSGQSANPTGILAGKTFCLKDNVCVAGVPQVNGTDMIEPWIPQSDSMVVTRILEAGGEIIGTATCENMSYSATSNTSAAGIIHNPYAPGRQIFWVQHPSFSTPVQCLITYKIFFCVQNRSQYSND